LRAAAKLFLFAAGYYILARLSYQLAFLNHQVSAIWAPTGASLALLLLWGCRWWPGIFLGSLCFGLGAGISPEVVVGVSAANVLGQLTSAGLINHFARGKRVFAQSRTILMFPLLTGAGTAVTSTFGAISVCAGGMAMWNAFPSVWITWWLGDMTSDALLTPLILVSIMKPWPRWERRRLAEGLGLLLSLFLLGWAICCGGPKLAAIEQSEWLMILLLLWAGFRFSQHGIIYASFLVFLLALWGTHHGHGPFVADSPAETMLLTQLFVGTISLSALFLVAVITEFKRTETAALTSQMQYRSLADAMPDGMMVIDRRQIYHFVNQTAAKWLGRTPEDLIGRCRSEFLPAETFCRQQTLVDRVIQTGKPAIDEFKIEFPSGVRWAEVRMIPLKFQPERPELVLVILRDLTEQKELQREVLESSESERQRIGYDLHDGLGQHLAGLAFITKALEKDLSEVAPERASQIGNIVTLLNQAVSQTRGIARLLAPVEMEARGLQAALGKLAEETGSLFQVEVVFSTNHEDLHIDGKVSTVLFRIAQEALHNAIHHGAASRIEIQLHRNAGDACLVVADNGRGISTSSNFSIGMGTRIMRYRVGSLGGNIVFHSEDGRGSRVECQVPII
jgi:PAS domain S-box-containing protein